MKDSRKTKAQLIEELEELRRLRGKESDNGPAQGSRCRAMIEHAPQIMLEIDNDGVVVYANRSLSGRPVEDVLGKEAAGLLPPESRDRFRTAFQDSMTSGSPFRIPARGVQLLNHRFDIVIHVRPIMENGKPNGASIIVDDVTELNRLERSLSDHQEIERFLAEISAELIGSAAKKLDRVVPSAFERCGKLLNLDRIVLVLFSEDGQRFFIEHQWGRENSTDLPAPPEGFLCEDFSWTVARVRRGEESCIRGRDDFPPEAEKDRRFFEQSGLETTLDFPLRDANKVLGFVGFGWARKMDNISPTTRFALVALAQMLAGAFLQARAEARARRSERIYRSLVEQSLVGTVVVQGNPPRIVFANQIAADMVNLPVERILGMEAEEVVGFIPSEFRDRILVDYGRRLAGRIDVSRFELPFEHPSGETRHLDVYASPIRYEGRKASQVLFVDITARKKTEAALAASEERFRSLTESARELIFTIDREMRLTYVNPAFAEADRRSREEIIGHTIDELLPPQIAKERIAEVRQVLESGKEEDLLISIPRDGGFFHMEISLVPIHRYSTGPREVLCIARDVSERMEAEKALRRSEEMYRLVTESAQDIIFLVDKDYRILFSNPAHRALRNLRQEEIIGKPIDEIMPPEQAENRKRLVDRVIETGQPVTEDESITVANKDTIVSTVLTPIRDPDGSIGLVLGIGRDVLEERRRQEALRESEEKYRVLAESAQDFIFVHDRNLRITYVNEAGARIFGTEPRKIVGKSVGALFPGPLAEAFQRNIRSVFDTGKTFTAERKVEFQAGTRWLQTTLTPIRLEGEEIVGVLGVARDSTDRKLAEERLASSEARLWTIFENATYGFAVADRDTARMFMSNRRYREMTGYSEEELLKLTAADMHPETDRERFWRDWEMHAPGSRHFSDVPVVRKDGSVFYADISDVEVEFDGVPHMVAIIQDVTKRREAEQALRKSTELFEKTFDSLVDAVFIIDRERGVVTDCNAAVEQVFGYDAEDCIGRHPAMLLPEDDDRAPFRKLLFETIEQKGVMKNHEMILKKKDGTLFPVSHTVVPLYDEENECFGWISVSRDITERVEAEETKRRYLEELETRVRERTRQIEKLEAMRAQDQKLVAVALMAARIAHEIRNPLGGIKNSLTLIGDAVDQNHKYARYLDVANLEIDHIAEIVGQMFKLYRPIQGTYQPVNLQAFMEEMCAILEPVVEKHKVRLQCRVSIGNELIRLPRGLLSEIMHNLIRNAVEASPEGASVSASIERKDGSLIVVVRDNGPGIPEDHRDRIFDPFFTTKGEDRTGGLGLGLSIVRANLRALGGSIELISEEGMGTTFRVILPVDE